MRQRTFVLAMSVVVLTSFAISGVRAASPGNQTAPQGTPASASGAGLPDGPGKDVTVRICGVCHDAQRAASVRLTRDGWAGLIQDMVKRGARGTDDELAQVLDYLSTNFAGEAPRPVNINTAPRIDLELVIGLLRRESAALVAYREKHGPFKSVDDLKKVPGLDFKKIEAARNRIVCF